MSIPKLEFPPFHLPDEAEALRGEVRAFLKETLPKVQDRGPLRELEYVLAGVQPGAGQARLDRHHWPKKYGGTSGASSTAMSSPRSSWATARRPARTGWPIASRDRCCCASAARSSASPSCRASRGRMLFLHRHERAGLRLRPRLGAHPRRAGARRLSRQRHQGVDLGRPSQPLLRRAGAHLGPARRPSQGAEPAPDRPQDAGHHHPADHQSGGPPRLERGDLHRLLRPRKLPDRQRGRRLAAGHERAGLRAFGARALPAEFLRPARAGARARPPALQARRRHPRPAGRPPLDAAADVGVGRRLDGGRQVARHRGRAGQGSRHDLPAGPARDRARASPNRTPRAKTTWPISSTSPSTAP